MSVLRLRSIIKRIHRWRNVVKPLTQEQTKHRISTTQPNRPGVKQLVIQKTKHQEQSSFF
jgi:hypothetical protein